MGITPVGRHLVGAVSCERVAWALTLTFVRSAGGGPVAALKDAGGDAVMRRWRRLRRRLRRRRRLLLTRNTRNTRMLGVSAAAPRASRAKINAARQSESSRRHTKWSRAQPRARPAGATGPGRVGRPQARGLACSATRAARPLATGRGVAQREGLATGQQTDRPARGPGGQAAGGKLARPQARAEQSWCGAMHSLVGVCVCLLPRWQPQSFRAGSSRRRSRPAVSALHERRPSAGKGLRAGQIVRAACRPRRWKSSFRIG